VRLRPSLRRRHRHRRRRRGRVVWSRPSGPELIGEVKAAGFRRGGLKLSLRPDRLRRRKGAAGAPTSPNPAFAAPSATRPRLPDIASSPKGASGLATATYGGVALWYARIEGAEAADANWAGSHVAGVGRRTASSSVSSMQEGQLARWRLSDVKSMQRRLSGQGEVDDLPAWRPDHGHLPAPTARWSGRSAAPTARWASRPSEVAYDESRFTSRVAACRRAPFSVRDDPAGHEPDGDPGWRRARAAGRPRGWLKRFVIGDFGGLLAHRAVGAAERPDHRALEPEVAMIWPSKQKSSTHLGR